MEVGTQSYIEHAVSVVTDLMSLRDPGLVIVKTRTQGQLFVELLGEDRRMIARVDVLDRGEVQILNPGSRMNSVIRELSAELSKCNVVNEIV